MTLKEITYENIETDCFYYFISNGRNMGELYYKVIEKNLYHSIIFFFKREKEVDISKSKYLLNEYMLSYSYYKLHKFNCDDNIKKLLLSEDESLVQLALNLCDKELYKLLYNAI